MGGGGLGPGLLRIGIACEETFFSPTSASLRESSAYIPPPPSLLSVVFPLDLFLSFYCLSRNSFRNLYACVIFIIIHVLSCSRE